MVEPDLEDDGQKTPRDASSSAGLALPKNRSTGNLLSQSSNGPEPNRIRFSFDAASMMDLEGAAISPLIAEHEHGLGASGLRRIRQLPPPRTPTLPSSESSSFSSSLPPRSSSMTLSLPSTKASATVGTAGPVSPTLQFGEDLSRFPSESLHSFSFAHQSEDSLHHRQNILKRSIEFMRDRLGWAANSPGIANAQARLSGDTEVQSMMELLSRANLVGKDPNDLKGLGLLGGAMTGPAMGSAENLFDKSFKNRSESPENLSKEPEASKSDSVPVVEPDVMSGQGLDEVQEPPQPRPHSMIPGSTRRMSLKRTYTDISSLSLQTKLLEALAQPYQSSDQAEGGLSSSIISSYGSSLPPTTTGSLTPGPIVHGHTSRWAPAAQAIFTTQATPPWTILAANDLACLVFGVTKAEVRKIGILEVVQEERRAWLEEKLAMPGSESTKQKPKLPYSQSQRGSPISSALVSGNGVTAQLLSKPPSRYSAASRRSQTDDGSGSTYDRKKGKASPNDSHHSSNRSRGVLLCGDVVPILKRNGATGSASLWVKEKRGGLIWVLEEIVEDVAHLDLEPNGSIIRSWGATDEIWGDQRVSKGLDIWTLIPLLPKSGEGGSAAIDFGSISSVKHFTGRTSDNTNVPLTIEVTNNFAGIRASSFPHIAGIMVLNASSLDITSSNSVFSAALFGQPNPEGQSITDFIPGFDRILRVLTEEDRIRFVDGIVIPEHSFRRARAVLALREGKADAASIFLRPSGLLAKHRDGNEIKVDLQMRVVKSDVQVPNVSEHVIEEKDEGEGSSDGGISLSEVVYALWITYSRHIHAAPQKGMNISPYLSRPGTPPHQPSPGQTNIPDPIGSEDLALTARSQTSLLAEQIREATSEPLVPTASHELVASSVDSTEPPRKKMISDFVILEEMGQGAYGQVKLARYKRHPSRKVVLKYVTKRRILVDTWTRDRRLGTVPLEIHVLDYLRRDGFRHPNIVEMVDFFEDDINYYIEMLPHGHPGMDLFDYIELRVNMDEAECQSIFTQVVSAVHFLHTQALVVHRDIKDENVVLDGEGRIKLIDFGSAAYIKNGPFDVFVGTIDYAAPEVLGGKQYRGKEQDVWALGILLYTIVYKENPFYSIDEIMDHDLRVPYIMSENSIALIRAMLDRDVDARFTITQVSEHAWCQKEKDA
ncbi:MAG: hypothetical protein M1814_005652 [Vezdaea aestivalis]|nr:MAG: hypothetical protein M1814_005652 [Vezdaea aestivalis]